MNWQRVVTLAILVAGSIIADALGSKELAYMLAGAAGGAAIPDKPEDKKRLPEPRIRRKTLPPGGE